MDAADVLTTSRIAVALLLGATGAAPHAPRRALLALFAWGIASDWIDGPLARRRGVTAGGKAADLRADSLLTLGSTVAAVRHGGLPWPALLAPSAHFIARPPHGADARRWDRATGIATMTLIALAFTSATIATRALAPAVIAVRCAHVATRLDFALPTGGGPLGPNPRREDR